MELYFRFFQHGEIHVVVNHFHSRTESPGIGHQVGACGVYPQVDVAGGAVERIGIEQCVALSFEHHAAHAFVREFCAHFCRQPVQVAVMCFGLLHEAYPGHQHFRGWLLSGRKFFHSVEHDGGHGLFAGHVVKGGPFVCDYFYRAVRDAADGEFDELEEFFFCRGEKDCFFVHRVLGLSCRFCKSKDYPWITQTVFGDWLAKSQSVYLAFRDLLMLFLFFPIFWKTLCGDKCTKIC